MRAADVLARLFVVAATSPASRKFHGTKRSARCSRRVWISLLSCSEASTRFTMERSLVDAGSAPTRMTISPSSTAVPAKTSSPAMRSTASGSPVSAAWLTMAAPRTTTPSTHTGMPARATTRSPARRLWAGTVTSSPSSRRRAFWGMAMRERMSSCSERSRVASSRTSPRSRRNMVLAAVLGSRLTNDRPMAVASSTGTSRRCRMSEVRPARRNPR